MSNKLFTKSIERGRSRSSKIRKQRDYLISNEIASELNTYVSFQPFTVFNDIYAPEYKKEGKEVKDVTKNGPGALGVRSVFNKAGAVMLGAGIKTTEDIITKKASEWRISNNVPLMDNRETRKAIYEHSSCTVKDLVTASSNGELGKSTYDYSDFMYCKHLGKMSNNYMITLRRFPLPVDDYISTMGMGETRRNKYITSQNAQSIGCMVTWMGTAGNDLSNILKYSVAMPFKAAKAQLHDKNLDADSKSSFLGGMSALFDSKYRQQYMDSEASGAVDKVFGSLFGNDANAHYPARDWNNFRDSSKVYGPVDVIKDTYMRSEDGIDFKQSFSLVFEYELRSYNGINGRQAMLDLLSNILNVTYTTGTFWGGGYRGGGAHQNNIFANMNIFKKGHRGFTDYIDSFTKDVNDISKKLPKIDSGNIAKVIKSALNSLGGMLIAGALNKLGRPQKMQAMSILSPAPVGFWHVTIGNPHHPIMSIGNMILKNTTIEHFGPLGLDDFPTGIRVTCELERGKSRDIRDIEKLYMHGNDRIYSSMGPKIFDMYKKSTEYRNKYKSPKPVEGNADATIPTNAGDMTISDIGGLSHVLQKYFGHKDTYSIYVAACEQEMGAHKKKKTGPAGGDSRAGGKGTIHQ